MCGIIGQIKFDIAVPPKPLIKAISHRGPDGYGEWKNKDGNVYFGHTRLAILEPTAAGYQPMVHYSGEYAITFNGEIYNHLEIRDLFKGHVWNGTSDTETLLQLLVTRGLQALPLLKGMFAFAFYNFNDQSITLVRDRLGIKPLWIKEGEHYINFSSEVRALLQNGDNLLLDDALSQYISYGRMPSAGEISPGITSLLPGSFMKMYFDGRVEKHTWWPPKKLPVKKVGTHQQVVATVRSSVVKAIEEHLISDVGVGAFLSGGIDSSIVSLVAGKALGSQLKTFTVGFKQSSFDERTIAKQVARQAGSTHSELEVSEEECLKSVMEAVDCLDLPSVDAINTYIVSKAVHDTGLKVALSGLGGDELFGGYPSFKNIPMLDWLGHVPKPLGSKIVALMPANIREKISGLSDLSTHNLTLSRRRFTSINKLKTFGFTTFNEEAQNVPAGLDLMGKISWAEIQGYMIPMLLRDSDQMSMAVGLEIRVPFLDHALVEEVIAIPSKHKKGKGVKPLLVEAFIDELPREVFDRPKQGFELPMASWIKGPLNQFTINGVNMAAEITGLKEPQLQLENFSNNLSHWTRVWKWAVLGHWLQKQQFRCAFSSAKPLKQIA